MSPPLPFARGPIHGHCLSCSQHWLIYYKHLALRAAVPAGLRQKAYDELRVEMGNKLLRWQGYRQRKECHESLVLFHHMLRRRD